MLTVILATDDDYTLTDPADTLVRIISDGVTVDLVADSGYSVQNAASITLTDGQWVLLELNIAAKNWVITDANVDADVVPDPAPNTPFYTKEQFTTDGASTHVLTLINDNQTVQFLFFGGVRAPLTVDAQYTYDDLTKTITWLTDIPGAGIECLAVFEDITVTTPPNT